MFVDWAGQSVPIRNGADGTTEPASLFVAALGASGKIFAEAFPDQKLHSWISAHGHAFEFYGGVAALTIPDNTRRRSQWTPCRFGCPRLREHSKRRNRSKQGALIAHKRSGQTGEASRSTACQRRASAAIRANGSLESGSKVAA